ncbi:hypothetical protein J2X69_004500 [Algoriphagus sp. 4150]|nr:hypothetical protein [Algoriphagus sp. 4150]
MIIINDAGHLSCFVNLANRPKLPKSIVYQILLVYQILYCFYLFIGRKADIYKFGLPKAYSNRNSPLPDNWPYFLHLEHLYASFLVT